MTTLVPVIKTAGKSCSTSKSYIFYSDFHFRVWRSLVVQPCELRECVWFRSGSGRDGRFFQRFNSSDKTSESQHPRGWMWKGTGISGIPVDNSQRMGLRRIQICTPLVGTSLLIQIARTSRILPGGRQGLPWSPDAALMDTVARLQRDLNDMRAESRYLSDAGGWVFSTPTQTDDIYVH